MKRVIDHQVLWRNYCPRSEGRGRRTVFVMMMMMMMMLEGILSV